MKSTLRMNGVYVQYTHEQGYAKDMVDIKWSGNQERTVRSRIGDYRGVPWGASY